MTCRTATVCVVATIIAGGLGWDLSLSAAAAPATAAGLSQIEQPNPANTQDEVKRAEVRKLDAERIKLELESKEIQRRLNAKWWEGSTFSQYLVAVLITAAILFGWARAYLEPILRRESELNALAERRNSAQNALLEAENKKLSVERMQIEAEKESLKKDRDRLSKESEQLTGERDAFRDKQELLKRVVSGLKIAVTQAAKKSSPFFSILNSGDPINRLSKSYGWEMWSDSNAWLGYYLVIKHPGVNEGQKMFVGRVMEMDDLKRESPDKWRESVERINERAPVIILDHTYFALLVDEQAFVGGEVYKKGGEVFEFYAPLSNWAEQLERLLRQ